MPEGVVARLLPAPLPDDQAVQVSGRRGRYAETSTRDIVPWRYAMADEGSYFTATNATLGTSSGLGALTTSYSDLKAIFQMQNTDQPSNPAAKSIYLDYLRLMITVPVTGTAPNQDFLFVKG